MRTRDLGRWVTVLALAWSVWTCGPVGGADGAAPARFTPLRPLPPPAIAAAAEAFSDSYRADNLIRPPGTGGNRPEYASKGLRERTYVDFDLGRPTAVAGFEHVQRKGPDTLAGAELIFADVPNFEPALARLKVAHVDEPGATTLAAFAPVTARYVRWQVTEVKPGRSPNLGGQGVRFFAAEPAEAAPTRIAVEGRALPIVALRGGAGVRSLRVALDYPYAEPVSARVTVAALPSREVELRLGANRLAFEIPEAEEARSLKVVVEVAGKAVAERQMAVLPAPRRTVYMLPHSHTDIGYTAIQTDIEEKQINNLVQGMADARATAGYPEGARFVWNVEVAWAADLFLRRLGQAQQEQFFAAVRSGQVSLQGMYLNELTGLCRPEELIRLFRYATELGARTGVPIDSAMISDVPGFTWGTVTALAQAGIRYFSVAPNYFDRIGTILVEWENKPFWWVGPDGRSRVLVWIPFWGYAMSHRYGKMSAQLVEDFCDGLERRAYPYEIAYVRWAGHGDNAVPDPSICEFVKDWNATHLWPRFVIASTSEAFRAFEKRHGSELPEVRGDWTPYWEDGAGSSAAETALNRANSDRLAQAETLWAMTEPRRYPAARFEEAWNNVLLYSEHTWGAHCSISEPAIPFTMDQWVIKQSYATTANLQSRQLLGDAVLGQAGVPAPAKAGQVDVFNTTSWARSELVLIPQEASGAGNFVTDDRGRAAPAQRLAGGELAVFVEELPPFSGRRLTLAPSGAHPAIDRLEVTETSLDNGRVRVRLDPASGGIIELRRAGGSNLVDTADGQALNDYLYLLGDDPSGARKNGPVRIRVHDRGPLVATLRVESEAPGCHRLIRDIRLVAGADHVELLNTVDKQRLVARSYFDKDGKESVNFAFPFDLPEGRVHLDIPFGTIRPDEDQMPSACRNWLTVGRWADVSNGRFGVTWVTLDAPLLQIGGLTANLLNSQTNPEVWSKRVGPSRKLYAWAMNNHWGTNYRAYQEGPVQFRFVLRPYAGAMDPAANTRFATGWSQPLVALPARGKSPRTTPLLQVEPADVVVTGLKPSDDGKALVLRLFGAGPKSVEARLAWADDARPSRVFQSDTSERPLSEAPGAIVVPASGLVTLRAEVSP